jgi:hypothetical protein
MLDFGQAILWELKPGCAHASRLHGLASSMPCLVNDQLWDYLCSSALLSRWIESVTGVVDRFMGSFLDSVVIHGT